MKQIATALKGTHSLHGHVSAYLFHPALIGVKRDAGDVHPVWLVMDEEKHAVKGEALL